MDISKITFVTPNSNNVPTVTLTTAKQFLLSSSFRKISGIKGGDFVKIGVVDSEPDNIYFVKKEANNDNGFLVCKGSGVLYIRAASYFDKYHKQSKEKIKYSVDVLSNDIFKLIPYKP